MKFLLGSIAADSTGEHSHFDTILQNNLQTENKLLQPLILMKFQTSTLSSNTLKISLPILKKNFEKALKMSAVLILRRKCFHEISRSFAVDCL